MWPFGIYFGAQKLIPCQSLRVSLVHPLPARLGKSRNSTVYSMPDSTPVDGNSQTLRWMKRNSLIATYNIPGGRQEAVLTRLPVGSERLGDRKSKYNYKRGLIYIGPNVLANDPVHRPKQQSRKSTRQLKIPNLPPSNRRALVFCSRRKVF